MQTIHHYITLYNNIVLCLVVQCPAPLIKWAVHHHRRHDGAARRTANARSAPERGRATEAATGRNHHHHQRRAAGASGRDRANAVANALDVPGEEWNGALIGDSVVYLTISHIPPNGFYISVNLSVSNGFLYFGSLWTCKFAKEPLNLITRRSGTYETRAPNFKATLVAAAKGVGLLHQCRILHICILFILRWLANWFAVIRVHFGFRCRNRYKCVYVYARKIISIASEAAFVWTCNTNIYVGL